MRTGTAVILCGGRSSRAGLDKQQLPLAGTTLPVAIGRQLSSLFRQVIIVTNQPALHAGCGFTVVEDLVKGAGPLGGIFTGLSHAASDYVYVTAGDMPGQNLSWIRWMAALAETGEASAVAALDGRGHVEPLSALFAARAAPEVAEALVRGRGGVGRFLAQLDSAVLVPEQIARRFSPGWQMFAGINTSADVERFLASSAPR